MKLAFMGILVFIAIFSGCVNEQGAVNNATETLTVNPCIGMSINLFSSPGDFTIESYSTGKIPDCQNITVEVLERKCSSSGIEFDLIRYGNQQGWVTRRLLSCPASKNIEGCDEAPDSICDA